MFCFNCGNKLRDIDKFCPNCGVDVKNGSEVGAEKGIEPVEEKIVIRPEKSKLKSMLYRGIILSASVCVLIEIILILIGSYSDVQAKLLISILYIIAFGVFTSKYADLYEKTKHTALAIVGVCLATFLFVVFTLYAWELIRITNAGIQKMLVSIMVVCVAIGHAAYILIIKLKNNLATKFSLVTQVLICITYSLIIFLILTGLSSDFYIRVLLVFTIATIFTTIATPIINKVK